MRAWVTRGQHRELLYMGRYMVQEIYDKLTETIGSYAYAVDSDAEARLVSQEMHLADMLARAPAASLGDIAMKIDHLEYRALRDGGHYTAEDAGMDLIISIAADARRLLNGGA